MKIKNVRLVTLKYSQRYSWPGARALGARAAIVEVASDTGLSGLGEIGVGTPQLCRPIVKRLGVERLGRMPTTNRCKTNCENNKTRPKTQPKTQPMGNQK